MEPGYEPGASSPSASLRAGIRPGLWLALSLSLAVHGAAFSVLLARAWSRPRMELPAERVITTRLVKLGERPRPKEWLPRLPAAQPPSAAAAEKVTQPLAPAAPAAPASAPLSLSERIQRATRMEQALQRVAERSGKPDRHGSPDGSPAGVSSFTEQVLGNQYATAVKEAIMRRYVVPTIIDPDVCKRLKAIALLKVAPDGLIVSHELEAKSGSPTFDAAVLSAIVRTGRLPPPPPEIARRMQEDGIELHAACHGGR